MVCSRRCEGRGGYRTRENVVIFEKEYEVGGDGNSSVSADDDKERVSLTTYSTNKQLILLFNRD